MDSPAQDLFEESSLWIKDHELNNTMFSIKSKKEAIKM